MSMENLTVLQSTIIPRGVITNREVNYKNGLLDGSYKNFTRKGNIISETNYKNKIRNMEMLNFIVKEEN